MNDDLTLDEKVAVFAQSRRFAQLDQSQLRRIASATTTCHFRKQELLFREEDTPKFFYIIQKGRVKLVKTSLSGKSFIVHIASPSNSLDSYVLLGGKGHDVSAEAMDDTTVLRMKREHYISFLYDYPSIPVHSIEMLAQVVSSAYDRIVDLIGERVEQRLYNVLMMLNSKFGKNLRFTAEEIADLSGTTRETAVRVLSRLRTSGVIGSYRGRITIIDPVRLREMGCSQYVL